MSRFRVVDAYRKRNFVVVWRKEGGGRVLITRGKGFEREKRRKNNLARSWGKKEWGGGTEVGKKRVCLGGER